MMSRPFGLGAAFSVVMASAGLACSAASESLAFDSAPGSTNADAEAARAPTADQKPEGADSGFGGATTLNTLESGILLVNATRSHSAFRVCPPSGEDTLSRSLIAPVPTALMSRSNLAGVDVGGAVALDPVPELANLDTMLVLRVDGETKERLAEGLPCSKVACVQSGGKCLGAGKVARVPVVDSLGQPVVSAFSSPGNILALRHDGPRGLRFEAIPIESQALSGTKRMAVDYRNLSEFKGGDKAFIGMQSLIMDEVVVEDEAMVAAGSMVTPRKRIPRHQLWGGRPARYMRDMTPEEIEYLQISADRYAALAQEYKTGGI